MPSRRALIAEGPDAIGLFHRLLSQNILDAPLHQPQLACWCQRDGRVISAPLLWKNSDQQLVLLVEAELAEAVRGQWLKFRMRDRVSLEFSDQPLPYPLVPDPVAEINATTDEEESLEFIYQRFARRHVLLTQQHSTKFLPQELGLDALAVDYRKGCYPGQEIVARLHYLGQSKRRLVCYQWQGPQDFSPLLDAAGQLLATPLEHCGDQLLAVVEKSQLEHAELVSGQRHWIRLGQPAE